MKIRLQEVGNAVKNSKAGNSVFLSVKVALVLIIAFLAAFVSERFMTNPAGVSAVVRSFSLQRDVNVLSGPVEYYYCTTDENGMLHPAGGTPQLHFRVWTDSIVNLRVVFSVPAEEPMVFTLYYASEEEDFSVDRMIKSYCEAGEQEIVFWFDGGQPIDEIRIDADREAKAGFALSFMTLNSFSAADELTRGLGTPISFERTILYLLFYLFLGVHFLVDIRKMYAFLFRYRWAVAGLVLVVLVCLQYHGSSVSYYNDLIQPGQGSDYSNPVLGAYRGIRSDEWSVSTPWKLSTQFLENPFSPVNPIPRAADTLSIATSKIYLGWGILSFPIMWGYFILPFNLAYSLMWYLSPILTFMVVLEFFYILTKKNALISVMGAVMIVFSSFYQWWGFPPFILGGCGVLVCVYYIIRAEAFWKKILFSLGMAFSAAYYVSYMYPAWMVPAAYLFFGIFVWMVVDNWKAIRGLKWKTWLVFLGGIALGLIIIGAFLLEYMDYASSIMQAVYPGNRISTGGFVFDRLFYYFQSPTYPYTEVQATPYSSLFTFFPLPIIYIVYNWIRGKKVDLLSGILVGFSAVMFSFVTFGWPEWLAKITLMSYSPEYRAVNVLELAQVFLLIIAMTRYEHVKKMPRIPAVLSGLGVTLLCIWVSESVAPFRMKIWYLIVAGLLLAALCYGILRAEAQRVKTVAAGSVIAVMLVTGLTVHPLVRGFDAIYSKPLAQEIMAIVSEDPEAKWLTTDDRWTSSFLVSCGAPTVNFANTYPNGELWEILDPDKEYEKYWNRYAHFLVYLVPDETRVELLYEDAIILYLNYNDLERIGVSYIVSSIPQAAGGGTELELLYYENGSYLYEVVS